MSGIMARSGTALAFATILLIAPASAAEWQVVQSSGQIWIGSDGPQKAALEPTTVVSGGETLTTGPDARVLLANGAQTMMVGPNSVVTVPTGDGSGMATILQRAGEVTFDIDRQKIQHFAVETPYLAAVVKGTHFTVNVDFTSAAVDVDRGLVEVTDLASGEVVDTPAGQAASVSGPDSRLNVSGSGTLAIPRPGNPRGARVAALSAADLAVFQAPPASKAPGLIEVRGKSGDTGVGLAAVGVGGNGDGNNGGGSATGDGAGSSGGASSGSQLAMQEQAALDALRNHAPQFGRADQNQTAPYAIAILIGLSILVPLGFAYLKGKMG